MSEIERVPPDERLRIAVLGDFDSVHTRSWLRWFIDRGHDMHAISFYPPAAALDGVTLHLLRDRSPRSNAMPSSNASAIGRNASTRVPRGLLRVAHAIRYRRAGLQRVVREIAPDVLHAHFLVEHGFYGALAGFHPYVVTAWGSDVLVEPQRDRITRLVARWTIGRADLLTSNNRCMAERMIDLGARRDRVEVITLGADRYFLEAHDRSVNVRAPDPAHAPTIISTRAHEPLYNIGEIVDAYARVLVARPDARLVVAHEGPQTAALRERASAIGGRADFLGFIDQEAFRDALSDADVFVSVPSSDGTSVALLQAMAAGCFPIVSDLETQRELIEDGANGFRVALDRPDLLADAIIRALGDAGLRRRAAAINCGVVEERGLNEHEMARMEGIYRRVAMGGRGSGAG